MKKYFIVLNLIVLVSFHSAVYAPVLDKGQGNSFRGPLYFEANKNFLKEYKKNDLSFAQWLLNDNNVLLITESQLKQAKTRLSKSKIRSPFVEQALIKVNLRIAFLQKSLWQE